jgi:hypothetical protein
MVVAAGVAAGYSVLAGFTQPFTAGADAVTFVPLAIAVVLLGQRMRSPIPHPKTEQPSTRTESAGPLPVNPEPANPEPRATSWAATWIVAAVAIAGWELYCVASAPRSEHPTLSSLLDTLDSTHLGKSVTFALWLALGAYLVTQ